MYSFRVRKKLITNTNLRELMLCKSCSSNGSVVVGVGGTASWAGGRQLQQPERCCGWAGHTSLSSTSGVVLDFCLLEEWLELEWPGTCGEGDK